MKNKTGIFIGFVLGTAGFLLLFKVIFLDNIPPEDELAPGNCGDGCRTERSLVCLHRLAAAKLSGKEKKLQIEHRVSSVMIGKPHRPDLYITYTAHKRSILVYI